MSDIQECKQSLWSCEQDAQKTFISQFNQQAQPRASQEGVEKTVEIRSNKNIAHVLSHHFGKKLVLKGRILFFYDVFILYHKNCLAWN